jgi:hypothetical protein
MISIVVYRMIILGGALLLATGLFAQKPAIDLISSHHQYKHPEAVIDTGYAMKPLARVPVLIKAPTPQNQNLATEAEKKPRRQIGPSFDSFFYKNETEDKSKEKSPVKTSLFNRKYNPIKIFITIIALK